MSADNEVEDNVIAYLKKHPKPTKKQLEYLMKRYNLDADHLGALITEHKEHYSARKVLSHQHTTKPDELKSRRKPEINADFIEDNGIWPIENVMDDCSWLFDKEQSVDGDHIDHYGVFKTPKFEKAKPFIILGGALVVATVLLARRKT